MNPTTFVIFFFALAIGGIIKAVLEGAAGRTPRANNSAFNHGFLGAADLRSPSYKSEDDDWSLPAPSGLDIDISNNRPTVGGDLENS
jgi:hypothetical protein